MDSRCDITVVMPVVGSAPFIGRSLLSLMQDADAQIQIVIVDDGLDEDVRSRILRWGDSRRGVKVVGSQRRCLPLALNSGIEHVRTRFLARMDGDDICFPGRFRRQVLFLEEHPQVVAVGSWVRYIDDDGDPLGIGFNKSKEHEDIVDALLCRRKDLTGMCHPAVMMRTDAVKKIGGYRNVKMGEDIDLFLRLAEVGRLANIPEVLLQYRLHVNSVTHNRTEAERRESQRVRIEAYQRMGIPLPENLDALMPPPPPDRLRLYRNWSRMAARHGYWKSARKYAWRLLKGRPFSLDSWKTLVRSLVGFPSTTP